MKILVKHYRRLRGLSQYQLAKDAGLQASTISQIESGDRKNPAIFTLCKIADALKISLDQLVDRKSMFYIDYEELTKEVVKRLYAGGIKADGG